MKYLCHFFTVALFSSLPALAGSGAGNDFAGRRVLVIGIDGVRADSVLAANTPNLDALKAQGVITYNAFAGGDLGTATQQATSSGPGWASITTGVWTDKHGVTNNSFSGQNFASYPHFFKRIREGYPNAHLSSVVHWGPIDSNIVADSRTGTTEFLNVRKVEGSDLAVANEAIALMQNSDPDAMFLHFDDVDHAGHASGYSTSVPAYISSIEGVDTHIGSVMTALQARPQYAQEDWLIIVTTDHGGINTGHGGQSADERTIFLLVSGGQTPNDVVSTDSPGHVATAPTAMRHLGIAVDSAWGWAEGSFGLPSPTFKASVGGKHVFLNWTIPSGGIVGLTGYTIRRDGVVIANLPISQHSYTDTPSFPVSGQTTFAYEIQFSGSVETALSDSATIGELDLASQLEMHLKFEDNALDSTVNNHDATAVGGTSYVAGINGKAATIGNGKYFTIPQTGGLKFGASTDFTVSMWVKGDTNWSGDPSFISNKDWDSGGNVGWIVAGATNGDDWQWNMSDGSRVDFDNGGLISDGKWHQILITHDRDGSATFYQDGKNLGSVDISVVGDVDTSFPLAIGADGELDFNPDQELFVDDVKIWRRVLTSAEASTSYSLSAYNNWQIDNFSTAQLADSAVIADDADPDGDGKSNMLEYATNTNPLVKDYGALVTVEPNGSNSIVSWPQMNGGNGTNGIDYKAGGVTYCIEYSLDLVNWNDGVLHIKPRGDAEYLTEGWHTAKAELMTPLSNSDKKVFYRLKVSLE